MRSLLVRYGVAMASVVLVAFLVPLGLLARSMAEDRALAAARQDAQQVAVFAGDPADEARLVAELLVVNGSDRTTTVFLADGRVLGAESPRTDSVVLASQGTALTARTATGAEVLVPVGGPDGVTVVRTAVPAEDLTDGVWQSWLVLGAVGVVLLAGTALAGDRIARRLSGSVRDLAQVADRLGSGDLSARVVPSGPAEVASVGSVLNGLGDRVADLLADERELVADLSHRLRTPITALRLDVDSLADPDERRRMTAHVDDLVSSVDVIIRTARAHDRRTQAVCDATAVVRERSKFWGVLAAHQGRELTVHLPDGTAPVALDAAALGAALDVLVDNVFRHTPLDAGCRLDVTRTGTQIVVAVSDRGPGFPGEDVVERGSSSTGSTGLGLDVARRAASAAGGHLELDGTDGDGARVSLVFPAGADLGEQARPPGLGERP